MFDIKGIRTFATSAKDLDKAVEFYTKVIGGEIVRKVEPTEEQLQAGQVKEVDVRLGNFEVHLFDGAVTVDTTRSGRGYYPTTWDWQNHPLVLRLYETHGKDLNFAGVILQRIRFETAHGKEVGAQNAARLAKVFGADGALLTWIGGGNAFVDVMLTVQACERNGVRTVLVTYEHGGKEGRDSPLLFYLPEADAVVTTGSLDRGVELPAMDKVIGPYEEIKALSYPGVPATPARGALSLEGRDVIIGGADIWGEQGWVCNDY